MQAGLLRFSGVNRPGLIEAFIIILRSSFPYRGFPGLIAPASLKRCAALRFFSSVGERFSGVNRPGLIEAKKLGASRGSACAGFSGVNRPGLIEANSRSRDAARGRGGFPGLIAPASLKQEFPLQRRRRTATVFRG